MTRREAERMEISWFQRQWDAVSDFWGGDEFSIHVYGTFGVTALAYWGLGGIFLILDYLGPPPFLMRYKVQENVKTYPVAEMNQLNYTPHLFSP